MPGQRDAQHTRRHEPAGKQTAPDGRKPLHVDPGDVGVRNPQRVRHLGAALQCRDDAGNGHDKHQFFRLDGKNAALKAHSGHPGHGSLSNLSFRSQSGSNLLANARIGAQRLECGARGGREKHGDGSTGHKSAEPGIGHGNLSGDYGELAGHA